MISSFCQLTFCDMTIPSELVDPILIDSVDVIGELGNLILVNHSFNAYIDSVSFLKKMLNKFKKIEVCGSENILEIKNYLTIDRIILQAYRKRLPIRANQEHRQYILNNIINIELIDVPNGIIEITIKHGSVRFYKLFPLQLEKLKHACSGRLVAGTRSYELCMKSILGTLEANQLFHQIHIPFANDVNLKGISFKLENNLKLQAIATNCDFKEIYFSKPRLLTIEMAKHSRFNLYEFLDAVFQTSM